MAGSDPTTTDSDSDGYTNQDEADSGTNPCSSASTPPDNDGDHVSDLNDADDDNDGVADTVDQYQFDARMERRPRCRGCRTGIPATRRPASSATAASPAIR